MDNYARDLVVVNERDEILGSMKALKAHHRASLTLHRAFSVFLFDTQNRLLLQKRSCRKLVYPGLWTNTCCSHPFVSRLSFEDPVGDARRTAVARLGYEMGISENILPEELVFVNRMLYKARGSRASGCLIGRSVVKQKYFECVSKDNLALDVHCPDDFAEHEVDYIFAVRRNVAARPKNSEVSEWTFVDEDSFEDFLERSPVSPWMELIRRSVDVFSFFK